MSSVMPGGHSAPRLFVSHSHKDNAFCRDYVRGLRSAGCDVWYDEHNLGWGTLRSTIEREMPQREHFVAIFSPAAVSSEWVNAEIDAALELLRDGTLRTLTFVLAEACVVPLLLRRWRRIEQPGGLPVSVAEAVNRTLAVVGADHPRVDVTPPPPPPPPIPPERFPARLAALGYSAHVRDGVEWIVPPLCPVPAGQFRLGSDKRRDPQANDNELKRRVVTLADYALGRFPVTVAEYACFLTATGRNLPIDWSSQLKCFDHPVVWVSWRDAYDYAAWLAERTGQPWRLPTEAEWEKAARCDSRDPLGASSERIYPWGDTFDTARCNTGENNQPSTTPVGWYGPNDPDPRAGRRSGASLCGTEEMAGNVWEWTASTYAADYSQSELQFSAGAVVSRVLRGGSWNLNARDARMACRSLDRWDVHSNYMGFRLVLPAQAGS